MNTALTFYSNEYSDPGVTSPPTVPTFWRILKVTNADCMGYSTVEVATKAAPGAWAVAFPANLETTDHATHPIAVVTPPTSGDINYLYILEAWISIAGGGGCCCCCGGSSTYDKWLSTDPFAVLVIDSVKAGMSTRNGIGQNWPRGVK